MVLGSWRQKLIYQVARVRNGVRTSTSSNNDPILSADPALDGSLAFARDDTLVRLPSPVTVIPNGACGMRNP